MPLTNTEIKNAKSKGKAYRMTDGGGLYLLVKDVGKYFRLDYRFNGKRKTLAIGVYPQVSLKAARKKREEAKELIDQGIDPSQQKRELKRQKQQDADCTFENIARKWFDKQKGAWKTDYAKNVIGRLEFNAFPYIGPYPIKQVTAQTMITLLNRIEDRGVTYTAKRVRAICSNIFQYAIIEGYIDNNPAAGLNKVLAKTPEVKHMAAITDPKQIGALLRAIDGYQGQYITQCALKLAPLLFVRPGELRHAQWSEINFEEEIWKIPATKMKMGRLHLVPLSRQAITILRDIEALTGNTPDPGYIFPSVRSYSRPMSENTVNAALRRLGYSKKEMTGHGFRSMASTNLHEQGWKSEIIEKQLAHDDRDSVRAAYNHAEYLGERRKMMQHWADYLDGLKAGGKIVPIRKQA